MLLQMCLFLFINPSLSEFTQCLSWVYQTCLPSYIYFPNHNSPVVQIPNVSSWHIVHGLGSTKLNVCLERELFSFKAVCCPVSKIRQTGHRVVCLGFLFQVPAENISRGRLSCKDRNMLLLSGGRRDAATFHGNQNCANEWGHETSTCWKSLCFPNDYKTGRDGKSAVLFGMFEPCLSCGILMTASVLFYSICWTWSFYNKAATNSLGGWWLRPTYSTS